MQCIECGKKHIKRYVTETCDNVHYLDEYGDSYEIQPGSDSAAEPVNTSTYECEDCGHEWTVDEDLITLERQDYEHMKRCINGLIEAVVYGTTPLVSVAEAREVIRQITKKEQNNQAAGWDA